MSTSKRAALLLLCLAITAEPAFASGESATRQRTSSRGSRSARESKVRLASWEVLGWGDSNEDAYNDALDNGRRELQKFLASKGEELEFQPSRKQLEELVTLMQEESPRDLNKAGVVRQVKINMELMQGQYQNFLWQDRQIRGQRRMVMLGKMLAGALVILTAVGLYMRLEESTKGYYTTWLRVGAVGLITAACAGVLLLA